MTKSIIFFIFSFAVLLACSSPEERMAARVQAAKTTSQAAPKPQISGAAIFKQYCVLCHGADGKLGTNGAKDLSLSVLDKAQRIEMIRNGKGLMTPFKEILSDEEIEAVATYTLTFKSE